MRLACNRDEQRSRPAALPPRIERIGDRQAILPIDPPSGGTWIGVNDAGLGATLLNSNPVVRSGLRADPEPVEAWEEPAGSIFSGAEKHQALLRSRGEIIPALMGCATLAAAAEQVLRMNAAEYPPFRLVLVDDREVVAFSAAGVQGLSFIRCQLTGPDTLPSAGGVLPPVMPACGLPVMFTSSGLGDALVDAPRRELFDRHFASQSPAGNWREHQDAFHRHRWTDRLHLSVCMSRPDARTVSYTVVEIDSDKVRLTYHGEPPDVPGSPVMLSLRRHTA